MDLHTQILALKNQGLSNVQVARQLKCDRSTVTYHLKTHYHGRAYFQQRRRNIKTQAVEYKGGQCQICGYKRCQDALEFHHLDPATKENGSRSITRQSKNFDSLKPELDKCVLLCANCHREVHAGVVKMEAAVGNAPTS